MRKKILIIESSRRVLQILSFALGREGYQIIRANDGLTGIQLFEEQPPDLIILDLALPPAPDDLFPIDNLEVCRCVREANTSIPILALASSDGEKDELISAGADDYLRKPFAMQELLARAKVNTWHLEALLSGRAASSKLLVFGRIAIDPDQLLVLKDGAAISLSQREYDLISFLAKEPGKVFTREDLMRHVWDYTGFVGDVRAVDVSIRRLREKIEDDPANPTIIVTRRGCGYLFAV